MNQISGEQLLAQLVERLTRGRSVATCSSRHNAAGQCIVSLSKTLYPLLSTGSTQEDPSQHDCRNVDWDVKIKKQTNQNQINMK